jgi:hypothetical protein
MSNGWMNNKTFKVCLTLILVLFLNSLWNDPDTPYLLIAFIGRCAIGLYAGRIIANVVLGEY